MAPPVIDQHVVLGKPGITEVTGERFLSSMDPKIIKSCLTFCGMENLMVTKLVLQYIK